jgi:F-type H+-transporting ATPase subunit epsilon
VITILTAKAVKASDLTVDSAERARVEAEALPSGNPVERTNKSAARDRAAGMKKVAAKNAVG